MHTHHVDIKTAISALEVCHEDISVALASSDIQPIRARILKDLSRNIQYLQMQVGELNDVPVPTIDSEPITKMFGQEIVVDANASKAAPDNQPMKVKHIVGPNEVEVEELLQKVEELYPKFRFIEDDAILDSYSELEIRSIAKRAGLPVTETEPKTINTAFIKEIKDAMDEKDRIVKLGEPGTDTTLEDAAKALSLKVDVLYPIFLETANETILADNEEIVIRGVAKRAGLPVTETEPKTITVKYIATIKKAITDLAAKV